MKKKWYESKTVWGLLIAFCGYFVGITEVMITGLTMAGIGARLAMK